MAPAPVPPPVAIAPDVNSAAIQAQTATPGSITQAKPNTCVATAMQIVLASSNPTAYREVTKNLLETGAATLPDGTALTLTARNLEFIEELMHSPEKQG